MIIDRRTFVVGTTSTALAPALHLLPVQLLTPETPAGLFAHMRAQSICDLAMDDIKRQRFARNALVDRHDVEPVTCLDQFAQQASRSKPEQRLSNSGTVSPRPI